MLKKFPDQIQKYNLNHWRCVTFRIEIWSRYVLYESNSKYKFPTLIENNQSEISLKLFRTERNAISGLKSRSRWRPLKYTLICWSFLVWSRHLEKLKNRINMSRNYLRYFKSCLMALILSLSKTFSRLLMLCVCAVEWLKQCEDSSHCSLWEKSSGNFKQSDSSTKTKNLAPI